MAGGSSARAIATPEARLFFEPQKTAAISSSFEKPSARLPSVVATSTVASSAASTIARITSERGATLCHSPWITDSLNAPYTTNKIELRSTQPRSAP